MQASIAYHVSTNRKVVAYRKIRYVLFDVHFVSNLTTKIRV